MTRLATVAEIRDGHDSQWLAGQTDAIRALGRNVICDILEIGTRLDEVKNALLHGEWGKWLDAEFGWSDRTALRYMDAAKAFAAKSDTVSDLPIDIGALYLPARAKTPPEVVKRLSNEPSGVSASLLPRRAESSPVNRQLAWCQLVVCTFTTEPTRRSRGSMIPWPTLPPSWFAPTGRKLSGSQGH
jgi:hypothetical protein